MTLTSCAAIFSSIIALGVFALTLYFTLNSLPLLLESFKLKKLIPLALTAGLASISLLYSVTYFTRNLDTGSSSFLGVSLVYQNCELESTAKVVTSESEDDDDYEGEEEIALLSTSCFNGQG